ncbi:MAG: hypothetical protein KF735_01885 [Chelatococcus sp.]|jgi:hypothetical protein|uniref:hypothetical protein n=1 Tax=unclassified Chelatococcus TaxID=2638111 RepID=UPI001BCB053F|nr:MULTISPECIES: hypothetical protein [unclassified Chelatococcus]CAH1665155.1 conserved exported hypothetical protein [Hyphomicrobiales bacterium]MBS7737679.1 hypothetical protein [Chelatococcus sp. HY11]MBX3536362.1 hypothetical protein [Chelatococcus sp.]MBX3544187.1 hypothetical protein [Chelatococcus sp.]MCO5079491.1 hypothetical protein [Chelatococcus sp.]
MRRMIAASLMLATASSFSFAGERAPGEPHMPMDLDPINVTRNLPACDSVAVVSEVAMRFASKESEYWNSDLRLAQFERIRQIALNPWGDDFIPRRFCRATTLVTDGVKREVIYSVRAGLGGIGFGWNVEFCVRGIDRGWSFAPWCKTALP